jgi:hypothetical protein
MPGTRMSWEEIRLVMTNPRTGKISIGTSEPFAHEVTVSNVSLWIGTACRFEQRFCWAVNPIAAAAPAALNEDL